MSSMQVPPGGRRRPVRLNPLKVFARRVWAMKNSGLPVTATDLLFTLEQGSLNPEDVVRSIVARRKAKSRLDQIVKAAGEGKPTPQPSPEALHGKPSVEAQSKRRKPRKPKEGAT